MFFLGIDVGGTSTDCIMMDQERRVVAAAKQRTTTDVISGIEKIIGKIFRQAKVKGQAIEAVMIGTTHCYRALQECKNLAKVCAIRIGQAKGSIPPLYEATDSLRQAMGLTYFELDGGHQVDGNSLGLAPSYDELKRFLHAIRHQNVDSFAITSTFSSINSKHEQLVAGWIRDILGEQHALTLSHELGSIGLIERENAAILNAALAKITLQVLRGVREVLGRYGIEAKLFVTQNDGSLMSFDYAINYPIRTLKSRATNSFRGAAFLTRHNNCVIVNVESNETHVGVLEDGFPKVRWSKTQIANIHANVQMPEIVTVDIDRSDQVDDGMLDRLYQVVQRFQPRYQPLPILFVGEGSSQIASRFKFPWADVIQPEYYQYVSAIGACIAPISGSVDRMYWLQAGLSREDAEEMAKQEAVHEAVRAGADPDSVTIQTIKAAPLAYIPNQVLRIQVRAVGSIV